MRVSETGALPNRRAAYKPPKPPPTITTRCADAIAYGMQKPAELILRYASPNMGHRVGLDMTDAGRHRYGMATIPPRGFYGDDQFPESPVYLPVCTSLPNSLINCMMVAGNSHRRRMRSTKDTATR